MQFIFDRPAAPIGTAVTGAVAAIPIVQLACAAVLDVATFEEFGIT